MGKESEPRFECDLLIFSGCSTYPDVPDCDASSWILDEHPQDEILAAVTDVPPFGKPNLVHQNLLV